MTYDDPGEQEQGSVKRRGLPKAASAEQNDMFSIAPVPTANVGPATRATDPETSRAAARKAGDNLTAKQTAVLAFFILNGAMTDEQLIANYKALRRDIARLPESATLVPEQSDSGLRTRRSELVDLKYIKWTGQKRVMETGGEGRVWARTGIGPFPSNVVDYMRHPK